MKVKVEDGGTYQCENGTWVKVKKNKLPYYKYSCAEWSGKISAEGETWTEEGIAYHNDCYFNFIP